MKNRTVLLSLFDVGQRKDKNWVVKYICRLICFSVLALHFLSIPASAASADYFVISDGTSCTLSFTGYFVTCPGGGCCYTPTYGQFCGNAGLVEGWLTDNIAGYTWCDNRNNGPSVSGYGSATCILSDLSWPKFVEAADSYGPFRVNIPAKADLCGSPHDKPDSEKGAVSSTNGCTANGQGSPVWSVNPINLNHYVTDTPLWYKPPYGPPVDIRLSYNSLTALSVSGSVPNSPFGGKWQFNYASYIVENSDNSVMVVMPDGREDVYTLSGSTYNKPFGIFNTLSKTPEGQYKVSLLDGTVYTYSVPDGMSRIVLTKITDAYNQNLFIDYDSSTGKLITIRDAHNRPTIFHYNSQGFVDLVTDSFNRQALFSYDGAGNLVSATDMGGFTTIYSYDTTKGYLSAIKSPKITNPQSDTDYRIWSFLIEPNNGTSPTAAYPAPGAAMGSKYRLTITNPNNPDGTVNKEEYYYFGQNAWYVSPRDYVPYNDDGQGHITNNYTSGTPKTLYYFDRPTANPYPKGRLAKVVSPLGNSQTFTYYTDNTQPTFGQVATVTDGNGHTTKYDYNNNGLITKYWDAKTPTTSTPTIAYNYNSNNIDLHTIDNHLGIPIAYEYNGALHEVTALTDHMNVRTEFKHNGYGQLVSVIEASSNPLLATTTTLDYDPGKHTLQALSKQKTTNDPKYPIATFDHDDIGRLSSATYADGVTINYKYEKLDQIKTITYPDQKTVQVVNNTSCPYQVDSITERAGDIRKTNYYYDSLKRLEHLDGPYGTFKYGYDSNSNMTKFTVVTDKNSMTGIDTLFDYDLDNRLKRKTYTGGKYISYSYDPAGLLQTFANGRLQVVTYGYDPNNNLTSITYPSGTPNVSMNYDAYNRVQTMMTVGLGTYSYSYDANNRLLSIRTPWDSTNSVTFVYDDLNRLTSMTPLGGTQVTYAYNDPLGRLKTIAKGADTFTYNYVGNSTLIESLIRPGNGMTQYLYNDPLKRITSVINQDSQNNILSQYDYTYNNLDLRDTERITNGLSIDTLGTSAANTYNSLNQITTDTWYKYDDDGNMTQGYTPGNNALKMDYDAENRLVKSYYSDGTHLTTYSYSGDGLLAQIIKPSGETIRYVRAGFLPIQERDASNTVKREYLWGKNMGGGIGGLLSMHQSSDNKNYYYMYDGKGNVTSVIDANQNVVAAYAYDPFGVRKKITGTLDQPFQFSTKQYDPDTGLSYHGFRFYSPTLGKWMTKDPLGESSDPNLYRFVGNSPNNFVDPYGLIVNEGFILQLAKMANRSLMKTIKSLTKQIEKHEKSLADECQKQAKQHHAHELRVLGDQLSLAEQEAARRGLMSAGFAEGVSEAEADKRTSNWFDWFDPFGLIGGSYAY